MNEAACSRTVRTWLAGRCEGRGLSLLHAARGAGADNSRTTVDPGTRPSRQTASENRRCSRPVYVPLVQGLDRDERGDVAGTSSMRLAGVRALRSTACTYRSWRSDGCAAA